MGSSPAKEYEEVSYRRSVRKKDPRDRERDKSPGTCPFFPCQIFVHLRAFFLFLPIHPIRKKTSFLRIIAALVCCGLRPFASLHRDGSVANSHGRNRRKQNPTQALCFELDFFMLRSFSVHSPIANTALLSGYEALGPGPCDGIRPCQHSPLVGMRSRNEDHFRNPGSLRIRRIVHRKRQWHPG